MKKSFLLFLHVLGIFVSAYAQTVDISDGYYRMTNAYSDRYIHMLDNKGSINVQTSSVDMGAIMLKKGIEKAISDPASVLYVEKHGSQYDIKAQDTGIHSMLEEDVDIYVDLIKSPQGSDAVWAYFKKGSMIMYLWDAKSDMDAEESYIDSRGSSRDWYIKPIDNSTDNYFGVKPTHQAGGKYYASMYAAFPFSLESPGMKAYYITLVDENKGVAVYKEISGTIPALTPVIIECSSDNPASNKLTIGGTGSASSDNIGKGVLFALHKYHHDNFVTYDKNTMRTIGLAPNGSLAMTAGEYQDVPKNTFYITVSESCPSSLKLIPESEYQPGSEETSIPAAPAEAIVSRTDKEGEVVISWTPVTTANNHRILYSQDFEAVTDPASAGWTCSGGTLSLPADENGKVLLFELGNNNGRSATVKWGTKIYSDENGTSIIKDGAYDMTFEFSMPAFPNNQQNSALTVYTNYDALANQPYRSRWTPSSETRVNNYLLDLTQIAAAADGQCQFCVNGDTTDVVVLDVSTFYGVNLHVNIEDRTVEYTITNLNSDNELTSGKYTVPASYILNGKEIKNEEGTVTGYEESEEEISMYAEGIHVYLARYNSILQFDNIKVSSGNSTGIQLDADDVTYTIVDENSDIVAKGLKGTSYTFQAVPTGEQAFVYYGVYAVTEAGVSEKYAATDMIAVGAPFELPYAESFTDGGLSYPMAIMGGNGEWQICDNSSFTDIADVDGTNGFAAYGCQNINDQSALFTGLIKLDAETLGLTFAYYAIADNDDNTIDVMVKTADSDELVLVETVPQNGEGWIYKTINLSEYAGKTVQIYFVVTVKANVYTFIDDIRIQQLANYDLVAQSVSAPALVQSGEEFNVNVSLMNMGAKTAETYSVELTRNGEIVASVVGEAIESLSPGVVTIPQTLGVVDPESNVYSAKVVYDLDEVAENNVTGEYAVALEQFNAPMAENVKAASSMTGVELTWNAPDMSRVPLKTTTDDFESYAPFATGGVGEWTLVDVDGGAVGGVQGEQFGDIVPGETEVAYFVMNTELGGVAESASYDAHSGVQYMVSTFIYDGPAYNDDWMITPELSGTKQTISFYAKTFNTSYPESFKVLYSTTDPVTEEFVEIATESSVPGEWTKYSYTVPEGAKYFAINCVSYDAFMFLVDDVIYVAAGSEPIELTLVGYNIYRNGVKLNEVPVTETSYVDAEGTADNMYQISVVYAEGESKAIEVSVELPEIIQAPEITFNNGKVTITCIRGDAEIHYTVDGTDPTIESELYKEPFDLGHNATVKARAFLQDLDIEPSEIASLTVDSYKVATPTGDFDAEKRLLTLSCTTEGASIRYTLDLDGQWESYEGSIRIRRNCTIYAKATHEGYNDSEIAEFSITNLPETVPLPEITFNNGNVTITCILGDAEIHYTVDGTDPTIESELYKEPFALNNNATVKARAFLPDLDIEPSDIASLTVDSYKTATPKLSYDSASGELTITCDTQGATISYTFDLDGEWSEYREPVKIERDCTVYARASFSGYNDSEIAKWEISVLKCMPVNISYDGRNVTLQTSDTNAAIKYTVDGSDPKNGLPYESSFDAMGLCQVKAIAVNDGYMDSDIAEYEVRGYADENHAETSAGGLLQSCYGWNRDTIPSSTLRVEGWLNDDDYKFIRSMRGLRHLDIEKVVDAHIPDKAFADTRIVSISMPETITQHGAGILSGTPYLCAVIWNSTGRLGTWLTADISNPNMLLYVHSGITVDDKWDFNVVEDSEASSVTLHHGYPFYAPRDFHADYVSLTREFKLETVVGKCGGWETIVLPFAPDVITHETSGSITPFAAWDGNVNGNMRPFWLKSSVADGWENATEIERCKPYIISMPNSPDYVESFNLAGKVTFSASSTSEKEIYLGPAASEPIATDWRDGTKLEGTFMPVDEVGLLAMNLHSDDNKHLPGSLFVDNETAVPFEAYVRNASTRRAMPVFGDQSGLGIPLKADVGITVDSPAPGTIRIHTTHERRVDIFTVTGLVVGSLRMEADETATMNDLLSGFYICGGVKVFVR